MSAPMDPHDDEGMPKFDEIVAQAYKELETSRRRAHVIIANARLEASEICQQARREAAGIVEAARIQAEAAAQARRSEIEAEARSAGRVEGLAQAVEESRGALSAAAQLRAGLESAYKHHLRESENEIVDTVLAIAERVLSIEQEEFLGVLGSAILQVLHEQADAREVNLVLNPADYDSVVAFLASQQVACDRVAGIAATAAVPQGACRFRSPRFNLDLCLQRRFEQVREHLRQQWALAGGADQR